MLLNGVLVPVFLFGSEEVSFSHSLVVSGMIYI